MGKPTNYISNMIQQRGENWVSTVRPEDIQNSGKRIIKEMVKGSYDYQDLGIYFLDTKFLSNLMIFVDNELQYNTYLYSAVGFYSQYYSDPNSGFYISKISAIHYIYSVIQERLKTLQATENISCLLDICPMLYNYRNYLN